METLLGLVIIAGQILGTVIVFGWDAPKWCRITAGILQIIFFLALIGLASN